MNAADVSDLQKPVVTHFFTSGARPAAPWGRGGVVRAPGGVMLETSDGRYDPAAGDFSESILKLAPRAARLRLTLRRLRLASGLILFGYVLTHLLNHALGNVSLDAMEDGLDLVTAVWLNPAGLTLLYGSGAAGGVILGMLYLNESKSRWRIFYLTLIIGSVVGLKVVA